MPTMSRMKRMHGGAVAEEKYAVAVRDAGGLHLFMWVRVPLRSEFFTMLPRPRDPSINAHASLHADGSYHIKSHGLPRCMERQKQKPDGTLVDTEHLMDQGLNRAGVLSIGENCDPREWNGDRKSTRLNSSHTVISYAVFCLKKKKLPLYPHATLSLLTHVHPVRSYAPHVT